MDSGIRPISITTLVSLALHASVLAGAIRTWDVMQATGAGISIELVSSTHVSNQRETERADRKMVDSFDQARIAGRAKAADTHVTDNRRAAEPVAETAVPASELSSIAESIDNDRGEKSITRSTSAARNNNSIIELLHATISEHKQYPYLARRQRREGIARIQFVLHPDGAIEDARLVNSSRTRALDRAALEAVRGIEPFKPAIDYLDQPEAFQVDVIFNVM